jgi:heat shock protein HslJ
MRTIITALFTVLLVLQACSPKVTDMHNNESNAPLTGTQWKLVSLIGVDKLPTMEKPAILQFDEASRRISGTAGCNNFNGGYTLSGNSLTFGPAAATRMMCPEALMQVEGAFLKNLPAVTGYRIAGRRLELLNGSIVLAQFDAVVK